MYHEPHLNHKAVIELCNIAVKLARTNPGALERLLEQAKELRDSSFSPELRAITRELKNDKRKE